mgnify:CR=1 FL=1
MVAFIIHPGTGKVRRIERFADGGWRFPFADGPTALCAPGARAPAVKKFATKAAAYAAGGK